MVILIICHFCFLRIDGLKIHYVLSSYSFYNQVKDLSFYIIKYYNSVYIVLLVLSQLIFRDTHGYLSVLVVLTSSSILKHHRGFVMFLLKFSRYTVGIRLRFHRVKRIILNTLHEPFL